MSDAHARHTVAEAGEPPSRFRQYCLLEALTTALIDGDPSYLFLLFGGYTRFPLELLFLSHGIVLFLSLWYGSTFLSYFSNESLVITSFPGLMILVSLFIQGIGYAVAEMVHIGVTSMLARTKLRQHETVVLFMKNGLFVALVLIAKNFLSCSWSIDVVNGVLYAFVVLAIHDIALGTPGLNKMVSYGALYSIFYSFFYESVLGSYGFQSIFSYGVLCAMVISVVQEVLFKMPWIKELPAYGYAYAKSMAAMVKNDVIHKPEPTLKFAGYVGLVFVGFVTSGMYAASTDAIMSIVPSIVVTAVTVLGALEQALIYEYSYRITYAVYQRAEQALSQLFGRYSVNR